MYLGSADLMPRNLNRRVEVLFPVTEPEMIKRLRDEVLHSYLHDEVGARHMHTDGSYSTKSRRVGSDCQAWFLSQRTISAVR